jgi:uncharacterized protein (TIGR00251 family)
LAPTAQLQIKVVPGSSRDQIAGLLGDALKIKVAAAPQRGEANRAVVRVLARALGIAPAQISIVRGLQAALKQVEITGLEQQQLELRLRKLLE